TVWHQLAVMPALILRPGQRHHVVGKYLTESRGLEHLGPHIVGDTLPGRLQIERDRRGQPIHCRSSLVRAKLRCLVPTAAPPLLTARITILTGERRGWLIR